MQQTIIALRIKLVARVKRFRRNPIALLGVMCVFVAIGIILVITQAAVSSVSLEPESGTLTGSAAKCDDLQASGGRMIKFGAASCAAPEPQLSIRISQPANNETVSGIYTIAALDDPLFTAARVDFIIDGSAKAASKGIGWNYAWNTSGLVAGSSHTISAKAYNTADSLIGNATSITVKIGGTVPAGQLIGWNNIVNGPGGAWHRLAKLRDSSWLRVATSFPSSGRSELNIYKSTDNARTWTRISGVNDGNRLVDNGFLYVAPNGELLLSGRNNVIGSSHRISQWRSTNNGQTWMREPELDTASGSRGLWEPYYYTSADNKVVAMWADETHSGFSQVLVQKVSGDNGRTWSAEKVTVSDGANGRSGMAGVVRMTNGQYIYGFEVCGSRNCETYSKKSSNGIDWPSGIGSRVPGQVCGPFVTSLTDGRIVVTSCRVSGSNFNTPVSFSEDFGSTWKSNTPAFTDAGEFGNWPAMYQISTNEFAFVSGSRIRFGTIAPN